MTDATPQITIGGRVKVTSGEDRGVEGIALEHWPAADEFLVEIDTNGSPLGVYRREQLEATGR